MIRNMKMILIVILALITILIIVMGVCYNVVKATAQNRIYDNINQIPHRKIGLLLGTSPVGRSGHPNQFFYRRIEAAAVLYKTGKIDKLIISGSVAGEDYDEPKDMAEVLVGCGIPQSIITLDKEGFRTISSIKRAKDIFGVDSMTIISQRFHNERAVFLAKHKGIDAIAYNADNTSSHHWQLRMLMREVLARVKAVIESILI